MLGSKLGMENITKNHFNEFFPAIFVSILVSLLASLWFRGFDFSDVT